MSQNENKIWKFVGIALIIYMIIWFWPVIFNRPFFNDPNYGGKIEVMPYSNDGYVPTVPVVYPSEYPTIDLDSPYNPSNPDPVAPPHSSDGPIAPDELVACTMEAKACPDGSYVGRTGPNCEFSPCPGN